MCSSRSPPGLDKLPTPQAALQVCTLRVSETTTPCLQYTPQGPSLEALLGPEGAKIPGRSRTVLPLQVRPYLSSCALVLIQLPAGSPLGNNPILQEVRKDGSLSVLAENDSHQELCMEPEALVGSIQEVTSTPSNVEADTSPPPRLQRTKTSMPSHRVQRSSGWWPISASMTPRCCREIPTCGKRSSGCFCNSLTSFRLWDTGKLTSSRMPSPSTLARPPSK